jgi:hypothetical protein
MPTKAILIMTVDIIGVYACHKKDLKKLHDRMIPHFHANQKMHLGLGRSRVLTAEFVEWLFDRLYREHGVKVARLVKLVRLEDEEMRYLAEKGFKKATERYKARKEEKKQNADQPTSEL